MVFAIESTTNSGFSQCAISVHDYTNDLPVLNAVVISSNPDYVQLTDSTGSFILPAGSSGKVRIVALGFEEFTSENVCSIADKTIRLKNSAVLNEVVIESARFDPAELFWQCENKIRRLMMHRPSLNAYNLHYISKDVHSDGLEKIKGTLVLAFKNNKSKKKTTSFLCSEGLQYSISEKQKGYEYFYIDSIHGRALPNMLGFVSPLSNKTTTLKDTKAWYISQDSSEFTRDSSGFHFTFIEQHLDRFLLLHSTRKIFFRNDSTLMEIIYLMSIKKDGTEHWSTQAFIDTKYDDKGMMLPVQFESINVYRNNTNYPQTITFQCELKDEKCGGNLIEIKQRSLFAQLKEYATYFP